MDLNLLTGRRGQTSSADNILRTPLLWMLLLRVILYTMLLVLSYILQERQFDVIFLQSKVLGLHLLVVYLVTIFSAITLPAFSGNLREFAFFQHLLDTLFVSVLVFFSGSSNSIFMAVYFFPIISGGLILGKKGGLAVAAATVLQYGFLLILDVYGLQPAYILEYISLNPSSLQKILNHFAVQGITFFLAAMLSAIVGTRLKTTKEALSVSIKKFDQLATLYKQVFDNITTGILTVNEHHIITSANNAIETITGSPPATLIGKTITSIFSDFDLSEPDLRQTTDFTKDDGKNVRIGYTHIRIQPKEGTISPQDSPQKIVTLRDISDIEKLEKQVRQTEKLAAIGMMSAGIAHDFRNPLTAISGSAQVLADDFLSSGEDNHTSYELTNIIIRESNRLIDTIADFLKFSRPEHADKEWFSLRHCLGEVLQMCKADPTWPSTSQIRLTLGRTLDLWADEKQMFTVFNHLIQNALAFCPKGEELITITAHEIKTENSKDVMEITISDNGPGVPERDREQIFEPFFTSRTDGTGLGLAIIKQTIEVHQGTIQVEDAESGGALFTIVLPLPQTE